MPLPQCGICVSPTTLTYLNLLSLNTYSYITFVFSLLIERLQNRLGSGMWDRRSPYSAITCTVYAAGCTVVQYDTVATGENARSRERKN